MGSAKARPSHRAQRRRVVASTIQSAAAACLGLLISVGTLGGLGDIAYHRMVDPLTPVGALPALVAVVVALVAVVPRWAGARWLIGERCGWPIATAGPIMAATAALLTDGGTASAAGAGATRLILAVAGAVTLGGVLLAAAEATGLLRLAIGCSFAAGVTVAPLAFAFVLAHAGPRRRSRACPAWCRSGCSLSPASPPRPPTGWTRASTWDCCRAWGSAASWPPPSSRWAPRWCPPPSRPLRAARSPTGCGATPSARNGPASPRRSTPPCRTRRRPPPCSCSLVRLPRAGTPVVRLVLTAAGLGLVLPLGLPVDMLAHRSGGAAIVFSGAIAALAGVLVARTAPRLLGGTPSAS